MSVMGWPEYGCMTGKIVGKSFEHVIDNWLVQFDKDFSPTYPYNVIQIIHTAIIKE